MEKNSSLEQVLVVLVSISLVFNAVSLYFLTGYWFGEKLQWSEANGVGIKRAVMDAVLELEYAKVGGKENFELMQKAQKFSFQDQLPQVKQYITSREKGGSAPTTTTETTSNEVKTLSQEEIALLKKDAVIEGDKNAEVTLIEYSDMECPFCIRQHNEEKAIENVRAKYGNKVNSTFKHNRWVNHPGTEKKAVAVLCAKTAGNDSAYVKLYKSIYSGSTLRSVVDVAQLPELAKTAGVDTKKWQECYDNKATLPIFDMQTQEANKFNLGGTPGTLVINNKTGKYTTIEGAYPTSQFESAIESVLK